MSRVIDLLRGCSDALTPVEDLARRVGLSSSRFQHMFTRRVGVPFRRYRAWNRLRVAWQEIARGADITDAAHAAGFFDSSHLAHEYRRTFGKAASEGGRRPARTTQSEA